MIDSYQTYQQEAFNKKDEKRKPEKFSRTNENQESYLLKEPAQSGKRKEKKEEEEIDEDEELQRVLTESFQHLSSTSPDISSPSPPSPPSPPSTIELDDKDIDAAILMSLKENKPKISPMEKNSQFIADEHHSDPNTEMEDKELNVVLEEQIKMEEEKRQLEERRLHLRQQDDAYETSVAIDRSKEDYLKELERNEIKRKEEEKRLEEKKELAKKERQRHLKELEQSLPMEPDSTDPNALHITFSLPNGHRFSRFFLKSATLKHVKQFVDIQELYDQPIPSSYKLMTDFPKKIWDNMDLQLSETDFQKRQLLRIESN